MWEMGAGLGHLTHLRIAIEEVLRLGHDVTLAARSLQGFNDVFGDLPVRLVQAPFKQGVLPIDQVNFLSFTHVIQRQCFENAQELEMLMRSWTGLFDLVQPDVVFFEHSPSALIASRIQSFKRVILGSGFSVPGVMPGENEGFGVFPTTSRERVVLDQLREDDAAFLVQINRAIVRFQGSPLKRIADIYGDTDAVVAFTLPELDPWGPRDGIRYVGAAALPGQTDVIWPETRHRKVFAYLQMFPSIDRLLTDLSALDASVMLYVRGIPTDLVTRFSGTKMQFLSELVGLDSVARQADAVISHGGATTTGVMAVHGVPQLIIPLHQEQLFCALRLLEHGAAVMAFQDQPVYTAALKELLESKTLGPACANLAARCSDKQGTDTRKFMHQLLIGLISGQNAPAPG